MTTFITDSINDWWVEFRPIDKLTLGLHDTIWADGAYLPIWDDHVILVTSVATALRRYSSLSNSSALQRLLRVVTGSTVTVMASMMTSTLAQVLF